MMPEGEHKEECIDDITNMVMDEVREVLSKYEMHFPEWSDDDLPQNLDDTIYGCIHSEIRYALEPKPEPYEYVSPDEHLSNAFCDAIKKQKENNE